MNYIVSDVTLIYYFNVIVYYAMPSSISLLTSLICVISRISGESGLLLISTSCEGVIRPNLTHLITTGASAKRVSHSPNSHLTPDMNTSTSLSKVRQEIIKCTLKNSCVCITTLKNKEAFTFNIKLTEVNISN